MDDNDKTLTLANPFLPTLTLETGETVYAGRDRKSDPFRPMRYGNQKQAEAKLYAIQPTLEATGKKGAVVKQGDRFLILVYDAPETIEIDPSKSLNVDSLPSWLLSEEERNERDRRDTDAVNRLNELDDYKRALGRLADEAEHTEEISVLPDLGMSAEQFRREFYNTPAVSDPHRQTASAVFNVPESDVTDEQRRAAKTINFNGLYGRQDENWLMDDLYDVEYLGTSPEVVAVDIDATEAEMLEREKLLSQSANHPNLKPVAVKLGHPDRYGRRSIAGSPNTFKPVGKGKIFATVTGPRTNPRNRHNQNDGAKHVISSNPPSRLSSLEPANISSADPLKDETLRRQRLKYKLTGGRFGV